MFSTANQAGNQAGGGLFGNTATNQQKPGGLFGGLGGNNNQQGQQQTGGGLFGQTQNQAPQQGGGLFGQSQAQAPQQQGGGLFGGLGSNQQNQQQGGGLFGASLGNNQQNQQQQSSGLFGGLGNNQTQQQNQNQGGGAFGLASLGGLGQNNQQNQTQGGGAFGLGSLGGLGQNNQQQGGGLFNNSTAQQPLFQNQNTLQQPAPQQLQLGQSQLGSSLWQPNSGINPREKTVPDQMQAIVDQWDIHSPNCAFKHYFYNKIPEKDAPFFRPGPNEDTKKWEDALAKKPGPGFVPVLCTGFAQMGERIKIQQTNLAFFNNQLHQINDSLTKMLQDHDTKTSIRAMDAKRKHMVLKQRCLALATKVQILRNRGYAMGGDEEDLRTKLTALEKGISDPGLGARAEEIWARMITVQERARLLRSEIEKSGSQSIAALDEATEKRAKKILEDYQTQLVHLRKELDDIQQEYVKWEKDQPQSALSKLNAR